MMSRQVNVLLRVFLSQSRFNYKTSTVYDIFKTIVEVVTLEIYVDYRTKRQVLY